MNAAELADSAAMFVVVRPKSNLEVLNGDLRRRPPAAARRSEQLPAAWQSWPPCAAPRLWSGGSPLIVAPRLDGGASTGTWADIMTKTTEVTATSRLDRELRLPSTPC